MYYMRKEQGHPWLSNDYHEIILNVYLNPQQQTQYAFAAQQVCLNGHQALEDSTTLAVLTPDICPLGQKNVQVVRPPQNHGGSLDRVCFPSKKGSVESQMENHLSYEYYHTYIYIYVYINLFTVCFPGIFGICKLAQRCAYIINLLIYINTH